MKASEPCCRQHLLASRFAQGDGYLEVPVALPGLQLPPGAGTSPHRSSCHHRHRERASLLHLPGSDGRGCQSPFLLGPAAASHHKWVWPAKEQQRNTSGTGKTTLLWTSTTGDRWSGTTTQREGSCTSSGSCTQANSALLVRGTLCLMATCGVI